jgi:hypothetical protein
MDLVSAASISLSVVSLSSQVSAGCMKGFVLLSTAQNFDKDVSFLRTMLSVEEYRFVQWADPAGLSAPDGKMLPQINQVLAEKLMIQLRDRLDYDKLKERYLVELQPVNVTSQAPKQYIGGGSQAPVILAHAVSDERRTEILESAKLVQYKTGLPKYLWWAAMEKKSKFQNLVRDVRQIVYVLWNLLGPIRLRELAQQAGRTITAVVDISHDLEALKSLQASLNRKVTDFPGQAILSAAVDLKVVREQLPDDSSESTRF